MARRGRLIILSGPSGAGKSTVLRDLLRTCGLPLELSVSVTTRAPRVGEVDGRDYDFVTQEKFRQMREANDFLECKEVFGRGDWYGTVRSRVENALAAGKWMILEIDVHGALAVMEQMPDTISLFVHPGSLRELEIRLRRRGTDGEASIARRLEVAREELASVGKYTHEVINQNFEETVKKICQLLQQYDQKSEK